MGLDLSHIVPTFKPSEGESLNYFEIKDINASSAYLEQNSRFIVEMDFEEFGKSEVIYFEKKGYQRKGMNRRFYSDFRNDGFYFDLPSIKKAYQYLDGDHINSLVELQENFQKNFIDNIIEGKSIFFVSW